MFGMKLYHGTQIQNIKKLEPVSTRDNAITKPVICFTPNSCIALFYIWNRSYKWVTFSEKENGKVVFTEHYKNMLFDFYNKVSGSIYKCDGDNPALTPSHMKGIYISETPIAIENEICCAAYVTGKDFSLMMKKICTNITANVCHVWRGTCFKIRF